MTKYAKLYDHLLTLNEEHWRATFSDVESILGFRLPESARNYQAWWANDKTASRSQAKAWLDAGWLTTNLNLTGQTVEFFRGTTSAAQPQSRHYSPQRPIEREDCWLDLILKRLAVRRPLFHSEADFQHALAWAIHEANPGKRIRLEFKPFPEERLYLDVWIGNEPPVAIELKYPTRSLDITSNGERFVLLDQGAQDLTRYDFLKDVQRLERVAANIPGATGVAVLLTNDRTFWMSSNRASTVDEAFRLYDGRSVSGELRWLEHAGAGTTKGREAPLTIQRNLKLSWRDYSKVASDGYGKFQYLLIAIE